LCLFVASTILADRPLPDKEISMSWVSLAAIGAGWMLAGFVAAIVFGKLVRKGSAEQCDGADAEYARTTVTIVHPHDRTV